MEIVTTLLTKLKRSKIGLDSTKPAFEELTKSCIQRKLPVKVWRVDEKLAMEERGERLKIFDVKHEKAPTLAEICLKLTDNKEAGSNGENVVNWLLDGIKAQNDQ